jgi:hypothetical protein
MHKRETPTSGERFRELEMAMARNVGDRYVCEKCGAALVYEKACPCPEGDPHSEICCGQQMKAEGKNAPTAKK